MNSAGMSRRWTKLGLPIAVAVVLLIATTAVATASSSKAIWQGTGAILYAGPSVDPSTPTTTKSEFRISENGRIRSVKVHTSNELVIGLLGDGIGGSAVTECKDRDDGETCDRLDGLLTGAQVTSLHNSTVTLRVATEHSIPVPGIGDVPVLSGKIRGNLNGVFMIGDENGAAVGTAKLRITPASTGTYACFLVMDPAPIPSTSLDPCIENAGGMLFPVLFDVQDVGRFDVGDGNGALSEIESLSGRVKVNAVANLLDGNFGGSIEVVRSVAKLSGSEEESEEEEDDEGEDD